MKLPEYVKIVEVAPRDGLQNETSIVPTAVKVEFINLLSATGLPAIEVTSFVSPKWIPQLADNIEVFQQINKYPTIEYPVLVPNLKGLESAIAAGANQIAVFTTPSEEFSKHNTNCSVAESMERITEVINLAKLHNIKVRGYLSCVMGCPYEGDVSPQSVTDLTKALLDLGCYQVSLGDTIGVGTVDKTNLLMERIVSQCSADMLAVHFHDTYGQALVNIFVALQHGVSVIDSSVAGLGGCPYAKGASGNVATEDVVYMLHGMGIKTHIDLNKLIEAGQFILSHIHRPAQSKVSLASLGSHPHL